MRSEKPSQYPLKSSSLQLIKKGGLPLLKAEQKINKQSSQSNNKSTKLIQQISKSFQHLQKIAKPSNTFLALKKQIGKSLKLEELQNRKSKQSNYEGSREEDKIQKKPIKVPFVNKQIQKRKSSDKLQQSLNRYRQARKSYSVSNFPKEIVKQRKIEAGNQNFTNTNNNFLTRSNSLNKLYKGQVMKKPIDEERQMQMRRILSKKTLANACAYRTLQNHEGIISGYAVSSQMGALNNQNHCRVCIAPNLIKSQNKSRQISFFGIYQGKNGAQKAEYMRENFHHILVKDQFIYYHFQKALSRSFSKIEKDLKYCQKFTNDYSNVEFIFSIVIGNKIFLIRSGSTNCTLSMKLGSYVRSMKMNTKKGSAPILDDLKRQPLIIQKNKNEDNLPSLTLNQENIDVRAIDINENMDMIILGSEGIYESVLEPAKNLWKYYLEDSNNSHNSAFIQKIGKSAAKLCEQGVSKDIQGRSMTVLVIAFQNLKQCFSQSRNPTDTTDSISDQPLLQLPYTYENSKIDPKIIKQSSKQSEIDKQ